MKERNDLVGAQGLQGVIAELSYSPQNSAAIYKILDGVNTAKKKNQGLECTLTGAGLTALA